MADLTILHLLCTVVGVIIGGLGALMWLDARASRARNDDLIGGKGR